MMIRERTRELENLNQKLMQDLKYARDIQKSVLSCAIRIGKKCGLK